MLSRHYSTAIATIVEETASAEARAAAKAEYYRSPFGIFARIRARLHGLLRACTRHTSDHLARLLIHRADNLIPAILNSEPHTDEETKILRQIHRKVSQARILTSNGFVDDHLAEAQLHLEAAIGKSGMDRWAATGEASCYIDRAKRLTLEPA